MAGITLDGVSKVFAGGVQAVDNVSLEIGDGEFMVLVGPSGCGKTTILRMVAGLEEVTDGEIAIGDRVVTDLAPKDRDIAMVFQNYALYPHMTVEQNLGFGLKLRKTPKVEIKRRVDEVAEILGLDQLLKRKPAALSGGQRQRVAMGRAMVREPRAFLMDEPLSNLDAKLRVQMRAELARLRDRLRTTTVYVTHDQVEAMTLGDRVAVHARRRAAAVRHAAESLQLPGQPVRGGVHRLARDEPGRCARRPTARSSSPGSACRRRRASGLAAYEGRNVILGIRPSDFDDAALGRDPHLPTIRGRVGGRGARLRDARALPRRRAARLEDAVRAAEDADEEGGARLIHDEAERSTFTARVSAASQVKVGEPITLTVNCEAMHVFDPGTGDSIGAKTMAATGNYRRSSARQGRTTTQSISTLMPPGRAATWTVVRAGFGSGKNVA